MPGMMPREQLIIPIVKALLMDQIWLYRKGITNTQNLFSEMKKCVINVLYHNATYNIFASLAKNSDGKVNLWYFLK